jgi:hypothetical protein
MAEKYQKHYSIPRFYYLSESLCEYCDKGCGYDRDGGIIGKK